jgi:dienelactone hydrolase
MITLLALASVALFARTAHAELQTNVVEYEHEGVKLEGFLAWDDNSVGLRPGVLVCPEWWGNNEYARERARMLASLGYVALSIDVYGKDAGGKLRLTTDPTQAGAWAGEVMGDLATLRGRARAAYDLLASQANVDKSRIAAIGYCMGGTVALELARSGADLKAIVCFHTSTLAAREGMEGDNRNIKGTVLICHGQEDDFVQAEQIAAFHKQMQDAGVDYEFVGYSGAVHSFTNKNADGFNIPGVKYQERADRRSWARMRVLFDEVFRDAK